MGLDSLDFAFMTPKEIEELDAQYKETLVQMLVQSANQDSGVDNDEKKSSNKIIINRRRDTL